MANTTDPAPKPMASGLTPRRFFAALLVVASVVYALDFGWYQCRATFPKLGPAIGWVHRIRLLAIPAKGNKVQYQIDSVRPEEDVPCVHSLFPHGGNGPCWYVSEHANDPISM